MTADASRDVGKEQQLFISGGPHYGDQSRGFSEIKLELAWGLSISLLGMYSKTIRDACISTFTVAFTTASVVVGFKSTRPSQNHLSRDPRLRTYPHCFH